MKNVTVPVNGLAYNWMTNHLYFIDSREECIKIIGLNHYEPGTVVESDGNSSIEALAIHPYQKYDVFENTQTMLRKLNVAY